MIKEIDVAGVYLPPFLACMAGAAAVWYLARLLIGRLGLDRLIWHPALFNTALYVILLSILVAATV